MKVDYVRVFTEEQNTARQEVLMEELGVEKVFMEKVTGKTQREREQLEAMLQFVRAEDIVVVESISRIARNTRDLLEIVERLDAKGVDFVSGKESIDTSRRRFRQPHQFRLGIYTGEDSRIQGQVKIF